MLRTYADIMLRVAIDLGVAKYPATGDNTPTLPTDPATLYRLRDALNAARSEFYADFPDGSFRRRVLNLHIGPTEKPYQIVREDATLTIESVAVGNPARVRFTTNTGLSTGDQIVISGLTTTPTINGLQTVTAIDGRTVSVPVNVTAVTDGAGLATVVGGVRSTSEYLLPSDFVGHPQGHATVLGGRGGQVLYTSADRVRAAHAEYGDAIGFPELISCERESVPQLGNETRLVFRVWPLPDQDYTLEIRGKWAASNITDPQDVEPSGHGEAIAAYTAHYATSKGLIVTSGVPGSFQLRKAEWMDRVRRDEAANSPRSLGVPKMPTRGNTAYRIKATNPWS